jgi:hypothetical protein
MIAGEVDITIDSSNYPQTVAFDGTNVFTNHLYDGFAPGSNSLPPIEGDGQIIQCDLYNYAFVVFGIGFAIAYNGFWWLVTPDEYSGHVDTLYWSFVTWRSGLAAEMAVIPGYGIGVCQGGTKWIYPQNGKG